MKLFKGLVISAVVVAWFFFLFDTGFAKQADELKKLDQLADEALQFTLAERYGDSLKSLQQLESEMNRALSHPYLFSMDEVRMLQLSLSDAKGALEGEAIHGEEAVHAVMKFRFVLDAIGSSYQPLWADMEDRVMGAFHAFQDSARGEPASEKGMEEAFRRFAKLYDVIYPSILLDFPVETVKKPEPVFPPPPPKKPAAPPKPVKVVIPEIKTKTVRKYEPEFTKSVLDQPENIQTGPTMRYSDAELVEFKELILKKLDQAKKELAYLQGLITRKDEMGGDENENRYMTMEDGSMSMEREQLSQMASRQINYIDHLEKALMRIENKTYGICRVTGKLIDKARLRAVPHATLSIEAKQMMNK